MALEKDTILARTSSGGGGIATGKDRLPLKNLAPCSPKRRSMTGGHASPHCALNCQCPTERVSSARADGVGSAHKIGNTRQGNDLCGTASYLRYFRDGQQNAVVTVELVIQPSKSDGDEAY